MRKVLSTKALDAETLAYAASQKLDVQCVDFIRVDALEFDLQSIDSDSFDSLAFTSANAVKYFWQHADAVKLLNGKKIFSLAGKTADELSCHHAEHIRFGENARDLAGAIINSNFSKSVLHICGNLKAGDLEGELDKRGIKYASLAVYQTIPEKNLILRDKDFDSVMFYSPSGIEGFLSGNNLSDHTIYCCIGNTTASFLKNYNHPVKIIFPVRPSPESMIDAITQYFYITK